MLVVFTGVPGRHAATEWADGGETNYWHFNIEQESQFSLFVCKRNTTIQIYTDIFILRDFKGGLHMQFKCFDSIDDKKYEWLLSYIIVGIDS
jgi:hypothetical protein